MRADMKNLAYRKNMGDEGKLLLNFLNENGGEAKLHGFSFKEHCGAFYASAGVAPPELQTKGGFKRTRRAKWIRSGQKGMEKI